MNFTHVNETCCAKKSYFRHKDIPLRPQYLFNHSRRAKHLVVKTSPALTRDCGCEETANDSLVKVSPEDEDSLILDLPRPQAEAL